MNELTVVSLKMDAAVNQIFIIQVNYILGGCQIDVKSPPLILEEYAKISSSNTGKLAISGGEAISA